MCNPFKILKWQFFHFTSIRIKAIQYINSLISCVAKANNLFYYKFMFFHNTINVQSIKHY